MGENERGKNRAVLTVRYNNLMLEATTIPNVNKRTRIPLEAIQSIANRIAEKISPDKIILFGSYAYGDPKPWSDVDFLVIMQTPEGSLPQMLAISRALSPHPFGLDILVHSPETVKQKVASNDLFLKEIMTKGKVLYEKRHPRVDQKS
jgi:predicted nucleotidyltransferase